MADAIHLDAADYWELVARAERVRAVETLLAAAQEARAALWQRLAAQYTLSPADNYRLDDATRTLHAVNGTTP